MQHKISILFIAMMLGVSTPASSLDLKTAGASSPEASAFSPNVATIADIVSEQPNEAFLDIDDTINISSNISDSINTSDYYEFEDSPDTSISDTTNYVADNTKKSEIDTKNNIQDDTQENTPVVIYATKKATPSIAKSNTTKSSRSNNVAKANNKKATSTNTIAKSKPQTKSHDKFSDIPVGEGEEILVSSSIPATHTLENLYPITPKVAPVSTPVATTQNTIPVENVANTIANETQISQNTLPQFVDTNNNTPSDSQSQNDNPFGVTISKSSQKKSRTVAKAQIASQNTKNAIRTGKSNPFIRAFSALRPEKMTSAKIQKASSNMAKNAPKRRERIVSSISSDTLKRDLNRAYLSDNQYLSPVEGIDDENEDEEYNDSEDSEDIEDEMEESVDEGFEEEAEERAEEMADDVNYSYQQNVGEALEGTGPANINKISETAPSQLSSNAIKNKIKDVKNSKLLPSGPLKAGSREVLQMKIDFQDGSSAVSGESVNLIRSFAQVATDQPTNSIEITIPESVMNNPKKKKLTARRLSIVSNILRNAGISERQIKPVLTNRNENSFAFRIVSNDEFNRLRISKGTDIFGEDENVKEYNIMKW